MIVDEGAAQVMTHRNVAQNFISILFKDTSKTQRTLLTIYMYSVRDSKQRSQSEKSIRHRTLLDL